MVSYEDWEQLMIRLAHDRGWQFTFNGDYVPVDAVFNESTYGPVLLTAAVEELRLRQIGGDMAVHLEGDATALFGARAGFDAERNTIDAQIWRLHTTAVLIESLPTDGRVYRLDDLPGVLPPSLRALVQPEPEG
jgi:hypothetical protein